MTSCCSTPTVDASPLPQPQRLAAQPLTHESFARYGRVLRSEAAVTVNEGFARRLDTLVDVVNVGGPASLCLSIFEVTVRLFPVLVTALERHPLTGQAFVPLSPARALVVVAEPGPDGEADPETLAAFITEPGQGILYAPGIWHLGLSCVDRPGSFQMAMWSGDTPDTDVRPLAAPVSVDLPSSVAAEATP